MWFVSITDAWPAPYFWQDRRGPIPLRFARIKTSMMHRQERKRPRAGPVAGSLFTTNHKLDGTLAHRGTLGAGPAFPINELIKRAPADGSNPSAATAAMLACGDFRNEIPTRKVGSSRYISGMAKRKRETDWEVIRHRGDTRLRRRHGADESALNAAIKQFDIRREDQSRLLIQPR